MTKKKFIDLVLSAVSALVDAAKSLIKFISYMGKMKQQPETT